MTFQATRTTSFTQSHFKWSTPTNPQPTGMFRKTYMRMRWPPPPASARNRSLAPHSPSRTWLSRVLHVRVSSHATPSPHPAQKHLHSQREMERERERPRTDIHTDTQTHRHTNTGERSRNKAQRNAQAVAQANLLAPPTNTMKATFWQTV